MRGASALPSPKTTWDRERLKLQLSQRDTRSRNCVSGEPPTTGLSSACGALSYLRCPFRLICWSKFGLQQRFNLSSIGRGILREREATVDCRSEGSGAVFSKNHGASSAASSPSTPERPSSLAGGAFLSLLELGSSRHFQPYLFIRCLSPLGPTNPPDIEFPYPRLASQPILFSNPTTNPAGGSLPSRRIYKAIR